MDINNFPRLLPLWGEFGLNQVLDSNISYSSFFKDICIPDFGGSGIDVDFSKLSSSNEADDGIFIPHKIETGFKFKPNGPTLPFLPPAKRKKGKMEDPCIARLYKDNVLRETCLTKLEYFRRTMKNPRSDFQQKINNLKKQLQTEKPTRLRISKKFMALVDMFPEDLLEETTIADFNPLYRGGTMALLSDGSLVHSSGRSTFAVSKLREEFGLDSSSWLEASVPEEFPLVDKGHVLQIEASHIGGFCVRQRSFLTFYSSPDSVAHSVKADLEFVKLSPNVPGEYAYVDLANKVVVDNYNTGQLWSRRISADWATLDYGSHPRHLAVCQPQTVRLYDIRAKTKAVLLDVKSAEKFLLRDDHLGLVHHTRGPYFLLTTAHHLLLCDERFPGMPVMSWRHMLEFPPQVCHEVQLSRTEQSVVLLCSQSPAEAALFTYQPQGNKLWVQSLAPPQHVDSPASGASQVLENLQPRLHMSHTGGVIVPHNMSSGFSVLLQSSLGDVFSQHFSVQGSNNHQPHPLPASWSALDPEDPFYVPVDISRRKLSKKLENQRLLFKPPPGMEVFEVDHQALWREEEKEEEYFDNSSKDRKDLLLKFLKMGNIYAQTETTDTPHMIPELDPDNELHQRILPAWEMDYVPSPPRLPNSSTWLTLDKTNQSPNTTQWSPDRTQWSPDKTLLSSDLTHFSSSMTPISSCKTPIPFSKAQLSSKRIAHSPDGNALSFKRIAHSPDRTALSSKRIAHSPGRTVFSSNITPFPSNMTRISSANRSQTPPGMIMDVLTPIITIDEDDDNIDSLKCHQEKVEDEHDSYISSFDF